MLENAAENKYYKGFFGRKVQDKVRESCHSKLISIIKRHKLENDFYYSEQPNGSMVITHRRTGNKLLPFGAQSPDDMKSVDDPTEIWMEEADQFEVEDMRILLSRLRTPKAAHSLVMSFNTATVMPGHWILKYFFPEQLHVADKEINKNIKEILSAIKIKKVFCNFTDNYFINKEEYLNTLKLTSGGDETYLRAIAYGDWGVALEGLLFPLTKLNLVDFSLIDFSSPDYKYFAADPADLGNDSFAGGNGILLDTKIYVDNIIYNESGTLYNERECAKVILSTLPHSVGIEGIMGWKQTAVRIRNSVQKQGYENEVRVLRTRTNKKVRIAARANFIKNNFVFRKNYNDYTEYAMFMRNLTTYLADGTSKHDDAPDFLEMQAAYFETNFGHIWVQ
jgi:PBSX family phage terminase large subunit